MTFSVADLKRFPSVTRVHFVECSGNGRSAYRTPKPEMTPQQVDGMMSNSEWTGVPLSTLLREAGVKPEAKWFLAEGGDACLLSRSIPDAEGERRRAHRLRAERRAASPRARVSDSPAAPGLRGQHEREVAPPHQARHRAVHDALGNVEVHRSASRRKSPRSSASRWTRSRSSRRPRFPSVCRPGMVGHSRARLERSRPHHARRRQHRRRQRPGRKRAAAIAGDAQGTGALPAPVALDRQ